jgi:hypothetical protein
MVLKNVAAGRANVIRGTIEAANQGSDGKWTYSVKDSVGATTSNVAEKDIRKEKK